MDSFKVLKNALSADEFLNLFTAVGWGAPSYEQVEIALKKSYVTFSVKDGDTVVGMARLLGDGAMSYYVKDLAVLPEYQGKGIGRLLVQAIDDYIKTQMIDGTAVSVELMSSADKEDFYKKMGFVVCPNASQGSGMLKMIRR